MDRLSKEKRSELMSKIHSVSAMEVSARAFATSKVGCALRHQPKNMPGRPDYGNKAKKVAVFIHGCYWHQPCPRKCSRMPKTNRGFWRAKFARNRRRHAEVRKLLTRAGYRVFTFWEHAIQL